MFKEEKKYSIQLAAQMSGLTTHTIRAWEKRYNAVTPIRSENGRRVYSEKEVDRLVLLARLTKFGSNISQIAGLSNDDLKELELKLNIHRQSSNASYTEKVINVAETQANLIDAVGRYQVQEISQILSHLRVSVSPRTFGLEILFPLFDRVRELKDHKILQDAQIQALFAIVRFHAGNIIYSHFEQASKGGSRLVLTSLEKEHHTFSLLISALLCCHHKKHFYYLNSNLPYDSIMDATKATEANILILSVPDRNFPDQGEVSRLEKLFDDLAPTAKVWLLGSSMPGFIKQGPWKNIRHIRNYSELDELLKATL